MTEQVTSFEGYKFTIAYFIAGFKDGHFRYKTTEKKSLRWPGFLLSYRNGKYFIKSDLTALGPPDKKEVTACNNKSPTALMKSNIFPFVNNDPTVDSSWTLLTPLLLVDEGNPWAEKIDDITYLENGKEKKYQLKWESISQQQLDQYVEQASYGKPPEFEIREFAKNGVWLSIPTFNAQRMGAEKALTVLVNRLPQLREKNPIIFDVRGNGGGASTWVVQILKALYGEEYLGSIDHIKNENALADDRLSTLIQKFEEKISEVDTPEEKENPDYQNLITRLEKFKKSYEQGNQFVRRKTDVHVFSEMKRKGGNVENPVQGKVYLLTDGHCFSTCLIFADSILSIPGVTQVGDTTNADTKFSQPYRFPLPSGLSVLEIPSMIRRNWERGQNEPYKPTHKYPGYMEDQKKLEEWIQKTFQEEKK